MKTIFFGLKTVLVIILILLNGIPVQAQLLKKLKDKVQNNNTESSSGSSTSNPSKAKKEIPLSVIRADYNEDDYGFSGIYYYQGQFGVYPAKFDFDICKNRSTIKGAEDVPACITLSYSIAYQEDRYDEPRADNASFENDYGYAYNVMHNKQFTVSAYRSGLGAIFQLEPGVIFITPSNTGSHFFNKNAAVNDYRDEQWDYLASYGTVYLKDKSKLKDWASLNTAYLKSKIMEQSQNLQNVYAELEAKKHEATEMPSIGSLNSKVLQKRALESYNQKYSKINAGWKHDYMYIHSSEWFYKKKLNIFGQEVESHREIHAVIVRTSPNGECRADLMFYVEPFESGTYHEDRGFIAGPVSYQGMPGGILNCNKASSFKPKAIL